MKHDWVVEEIDGGHLGSSDCWACRVCGVGGGPCDSYFRDPPPAKAVRPDPWPAFFPGEDVAVTEDCEETQRIIRAFKSTEEFQQRRIAELRWTGESILRDFLEHKIHGFGAFRGASKLGQKPVTGTVEKDGTFRLTGIQHPFLQVTVIPQPVNVSKADREGWIVCSADAQVICPQYLDVIRRLGELFPRP